MENNGNPSESGSAPTTVWSGWLTFFLGSLTLYALTANRGVQWQDSGQHILRIVTGEFNNPLGLALTHPLHHWLGRFVVALGIGEPAFSVTLISALAGAAAVANVYGCVTSLTNDRRSAAFAAASLGIAHTFWQLSTIAETYTLTAALLSAECWSLITFLRTSRESVSDVAGRKRSGVERIESKPPTAHFLIPFFGMFFLNGLGLANHNFALLTTPILALVAIHSLRCRAIGVRTAALACAVWIIGASPYLTLVFAEGVRSGEWSTVIRSALFGLRYEGDVLNTSVSMSRLLINAAFIGLNFPNLLLPLAAIGVFATRRCNVPRATRTALVGALVIHAVFALRYTVVDQHFFFVPMYLLLSIFGGVGFKAIQQPTSSGLVAPARKRLHAVLTACALFLVATPVVYALTPTIARRMDALGILERQKPYRDDYVYLFTPWSVVERSADRMSRQAVDLAGERGIIIVEDPMAAFAVRYRAILDDRKDVEIVHELPARELMPAVDARRPIVLVPRAVGLPLTHPVAGTWRPDGDLYVLAPQRQN